MPRMQYKEPKKRRRPKGGYSQTVGAKTARHYRYLRQRLGLYDKKKRY